MAYLPFGMVSILQRIHKIRRQPPVVYLLVLQVMVVNQVAQVVVVTAGAVAEVVVEVAVEELEVVAEELEEALQLLLTPILLLHLLQRDQAVCSTQIRITTTLATACALDIQTNFQH
jgi:hypothetical protein